MQDILYNLALIDLNTFCQDNNIDCSGTHVVKNSRGFKYSLVNSDTGRAIVTVFFNKTSVPTHYIHDETN